jgi:hypothetical protein
MCHIFRLIRGAPDVRCAMHMWAPTGTNAGGGRPPHPWRIILLCATHITCIRCAPQFCAPLSSVGHALEKVAGLSVAHGYEVRH